MKLVWLLECDSVFLDLVDQLVGPTDSLVVACLASHLVDYWDGDWVDQWLVLLVVHWVCPQAGVKFDCLAVKSGGESACEWKLDVQYLDG